MEAVQLSLPVGNQYGPWYVTNKGDQAGRLLADRHYSRVTVGARQFTRPGDNLVLRTENGDAVWVTWRSKFARKDGYDAWECTIFRNESEHLSSDLIRFAIYATIAEWGSDIPKDGMITYVNELKVNSKLGGYCYIRSGFKKIGESKVKKLALYQTDLSLAVEEFRWYENFQYWQNMVQTTLEGGELGEMDWIMENIKDAEEQFLRLQRKRKAKGDFRSFCIFTDDELDHLFELFHGLND